MTATRLTEKRVEKVWGRRDLPAMFGGAYQGEEPLGEIWFECPGGGDPALLIKYLFTSEKLSIQVHPNDEAARRVGHARGKDEAWIVLEALPGATIGLGLKQRLSKEELRQAALDGSLEHLLDWKPACAGQIIYSPAGTLHSLGPGLSVIEVQQNVDLTYRLFDYGRPRELQLEQALDAANLSPYTPPSSPYPRADGREILAHGSAFIVERWSRAGTVKLKAGTEEPIWLVPVAGEAGIGGEPLRAGSVWLAEGETFLDLAEGATILLAYSGNRLREDLIDQVAVQP